MIGIFRKVLVPFSQPRRSKTEAYHDPDFYFYLFTGQIYLINALLRLIKTKPSFVVSVASYVNVNSLFVTITSVIPWGNQ